MDELGLLVKQSRTLRELDVSWNILKPQSYPTLINSLGLNRTLLTLNLSWNKLVDDLEIIEEPLVDQLI